MVSTDSSYNGANGSARVIGIDLGTTNCCVVACQAGAVEVIEIEGERFMPSCTAFTDNAGESYLVGRRAIKQLSKNSSNTIVDSKRLIGRSFTDSEVQYDIQNMHWPFMVQPNKHGRPMYVVKCMGEVTRVMPEMVSQLLLTEIREAAEKHFRGPIDGAVVTVPAYFTDAQRQATRAAALQANLNILPLGVINEPTAAALAYSRQHPCDAGRRVLVFDFGGGTFDVSLVVAEGDVIDVRATDGNNHLGGEDITNNLVWYFLEHIKEEMAIDLIQASTFQVTGDESQASLAASAQRTLLRLKLVCEDFKCLLSSDESVARTIDFMCPQLPQYQLCLTQETFNELNKKLFETCLELTAGVVQKAGIDPAAVDDIIMVGGSSRIPKLRSMLTEMFGAGKMRSEVNPDEVVAYGAGVHAAGLTGLTPSTLLDVSNHSIGVATKGDKMEGGVLQSVVCPRFNKVGTTKERLFTTTSDNQAVVTFDVYEGESTKASRNHLLDTFSLSGITPKRAGDPDIVVKFRMDYDGTLSATAVDCTEGGNGRRVRKALRVSRLRDEAATEEREEMALQSTRFAANRHRARFQGPRRGL